MELQLALDHVPLNDALSLTEKVADIVDIIELGTPFVFRNPIECYADFKALLPHKRLLADYKIMDGGPRLSAMAFDAGVDICTVSARTWLETIGGALQSAKERGKQMLVDFMAVPLEEYVTRVKEVDALQPDYICIHRLSGTTYSIEEHLKLMKQHVKHAKIAIAGSINAESLAEIMHYSAKPDLVIVGKYITKSDRPVELLKQLKDVMEG